MLGGISWFIQIPRVNAPFSIHRFPLSNRGKCTWSALLYFVLLVCTSLSSPSTPLYLARRLFRERPCLAALNMLCRYPEASHPGSHGVLSIALVFCPWCRRSFGHIAWQSIQLAVRDSHSPRWVKRFSRFDDEKLKRRAWKSMWNRLRLSNW